MFPMFTGNKGFRESLALLGRTWQWRYKNEYSPDLKFNTISNLTLTSFSKKTISKHVTFLFQAIGSFSDIGAICLWRLSSHWLPTSVWMSRLVPFSLHYICSTTCFASHPGRCSSAQDKSYGNQLYHIPKQNTPSLRSDCPEFLTFDWGSQDAQPWSEEGQWWTLNTGTL